MCQFMKQQEKDVHIVKALEKTSILLQNQTSFEVTIENSIQEKIILDLKGDILSFIRNQLENDLLDFNIRMETSETNKPSTAQDRFNEMLTDNEDFRRLADELSLEI